MAANDEFPRGWDIAIGPVATGSLLNITIPGIPGITHILTAINLGIESNSAGVSHAYSLILGTPGTFFGYLLSQTGQTETLSWTGKIAIPVGTTLIVEVNNILVQADQAGWLEIQGYDI